jgi:hypothetical protein
VLLGSGVPVEVAARAVNVSRRTLDRWLREAELRERIERARASRPESTDALGEARAVVGLSIGAVLSKRETRLCFSQAPTCPLVHAEFAGPTPAALPRRATLPGDELRRGSGSGEQRSPCRRARPGAPCSATTRTDLDLGVLIGQIGVAPLCLAESVTFPKRASAGAQY